MLKLYDFTGAPSPRRAKMFLAEKGADYENIQVDIRSGEHMGEAFRQINPRCTVPALVTPEGDTLCENAGIAAYLEAAFPQPPLLGTSPSEKGQIATWNWRCEFEGLTAIMEILRNSSPAMKDRALPGPHNVAQIEALVPRGKDRLKWFFEDLNAQLAKGDYVAGDIYSVADITATVCVDFSRWVKCAPGDDLTHIHGWHERMKTRPSYKA